MIPSGVIKHCWKIPELNGGSRKITYFYGLFSTKPCLITGGYTVGNAHVSSFPVFTRTAPIVNSHPLRVAAIWVAEIQAPNDETGGLEELRFCSAIPMCPKQTPEHYRSPQEPSPRNLHEISSIFPMKSAPFPAYDPFATLSLRIGKHTI